MPRLLRFAGAVLVLGAAAIHLSLYLDGYRAIPRIGVLFLVDVAAAVLIAAALALRPIGAFAVVALGWSLATLAGFVLSRTTGVLGFREMGWDTDASGAFATELLSLVVIAFWFVTTRPAAAARVVVGRRRAAAAAAGHAA